MSNMPMTTGVFKQKYCRGNNSKCARYIIFRALGKAKVPEDLFPNQITRIQEIFLASEKRACECIQSCRFFNDRMVNMPATAEIYKEKYCKTENSDCARYRVFKSLGREKVPKDLMPNQVYKIQEITEKINRV
jgi:hypothetical protein